MVEFFFFNDTATTEIYTLSLHDALPISSGLAAAISVSRAWNSTLGKGTVSCLLRSEEHTSELQSQSNLVCRLLLEKKKKKTMRDGSGRAHVRAGRLPSRLEILVSLVALP